MIRLFGQTDTNFNNNGDVILRPLKAKVHKEDNGAFYLDFECGLEYVQYMNEGNIIVVDLPQGAQAFRITNPQKTRSRIITKAYHVFYDSKNYLIVDSYVQDKTCQQALTHLSEATEPANPFSVVSDINTLNSYRCVRKSWHDAIFTVLERWGGHLVRDNFSIAIRQTIGSDNGVVIRYAKNLKEISSQEDWTDVVTKLLPVGRDGILLNALDPFADIYLEASVSYPLPFTKSVNFEQSINENDYADSEGVIDEQAYKQALVDDLRAQATEYINENCVPKVNYTLKANIENITDVGDSIEVIDEKLGIDISTNVISFDYDCILGKYTELEFGNFKPKLSNLMGNISTQIRQVEDVAMQSTDAIIATLSDSYVAYYGNEMLVLDTIPKENATNVIKIDSSGVSYSTTGIIGPFTNIIGVDGSLKLAGQEIADAVVDEGTSNEWHYIKYKNGFCELDATISLTGITWTSLVTNFYKASKSINLPFNVTGAKATAQVTGSVVTWTSNVQEQTSSVSIGLVSNSQSSSLNINLHVCGTWSQND
jgi:phage minor structural protein